MCRSRIDLWQIFPELKYATFEWKIWTGLETVAAGARSKAIEGQYQRKCSWMFMHVHGVNQHLALWCKMALLRRTPSPSSFLGRGRHKGLFWRVWLPCQDRALFVSSGPRCFVLDSGRPANGRVPPPQDARRSTLHHSGSPGDLLEKKRFQRKGS